MPTAQRAKYVTDPDTLDAFLMQRRRLMGAGLAALALPAMGKNRSGHAATPDAFDTFVAEQMRLANIPGLAVGLARGGTVRLVQGYGYADIEKRRPVTVDTLFHIASITKTVTAAAIMQLADDGRLTLDEPVARHLDFPLNNPNHPTAPITFRELLTHTSSLSDAKYYEIDFRVRGQDATLSLSDFLKNYLVPTGSVYSSDKCFSKAMPGSTWDYSNVGYALLGYLASRIAAKDMRQQTRERIFAPLGMHDTHWRLSDTPKRRSATPYDVIDGVLKPLEPVGFPDWPVGMLRSSVADFTRFVAASANGGAAQGVRILRSETMAQMLDMQTPIGLPDWLTGQGLGWMASRLNGAVKPNHWGGDPGVFTAVYLDPASQAGVVLFSNASASSQSKSAIRNIASRLLSVDAHG